MNTRRIYKRSFAEYLVDKGCNLIRVVPDIVRPQSFNWIFEDNEILRAAMSDYTERLKQARR